MSRIPRLRDSANRFENIERHELTLAKIFHPAVVVLLREVALHTSYPAVGGASDQDVSVVRLQARVDAFEVLVRTKFSITFAPLVKTSPISRLASG